MFEKDQESLKALGAEITTGEIIQQPELWEEVIKGYQEKQAEIEDFLGKITESHGKVKVLFSGAGTSAFVGETVLPFVSEVSEASRFDFAIAPTTSVVSNPHSFYQADVPTILVSYARSGNSPESLATVELGKKLVKDFYQITITCAAEGKLAMNAQGDENNLLLLMPSKANDQGFAMTGSFTCMTLMSLLVFDQASLGNKVANVSQIVQLGREVLSREAEIAAFVAKDFQRVVYLGSGAFAGLAREVQLKILELTAGKISTLFDSSLGFRHGPKSFVDENVLVFVFTSNNSYTRQYDIDLLNEVAGDEIAPLVCGISIEGDINFAGTNMQFSKEYQQLADGYLSIPFAIFGQTLALLTAIKVGNKPDTPSPTGTVNRVVQGVTIYDNLTQ